jgi:hypothetical protein
MTSQCTGTESQRTVYYKPESMTCREDDKNMLVFRPESKWWRLVTKEESMWDQTVTDGTAKYTPPEPEEQKKTNHISILAYAQYYKAILLKVIFSRMKIVLMPSGRLYSLYMM